MSEKNKEMRLSRRGILLGTPAMIAAPPVFAQASKSTNVMGTIHDRRTLRIAMPGFSSPPFFNESNENQQGFDVELGRGIAIGLGVEAVFDRSPSTFDQAIKLVSQCDADLAIGKLSRTLPRGRLIRYSRPYAKFHHALMTNRSRFAELAGRRETEEVIRSFDGDLGVIANSSFVDFAAIHFPLARLRTFDTWPDVVNAIHDEEIDAAYRDDFEIKKLFMEDASLTVVARSITLTDETDTLAIAVRPDADHLLDFVNLYLDLSSTGQPLRASEILTQVDEYDGESGQSRETEGDA